MTITIDAIYSAISNDLEWPLIGHDTLRDIIIIYLRQRDCDITHQWCPSVCPFVCMSVCLSPKCKNAVKQFRGI